MNSSSLVKKGENYDVQQTAQVEIENYPSPVLSNTIVEKVIVTDSEDLHIGPKFVASNITYVDRTTKRPIKCYWPIILLVIALVIVGIIAIVMVIVDKPGPMPQPQPTDPPTTTVTDSPDTGGTEVTMVTVTETTAPPTPPTDWAVPYNDWSVASNPPECIPMACSANKQCVWTVSIDSISTRCKGVEDLRNLEYLQGIKHNFYITPNGYAYEGLGWTCTSEYKEFFSRNTVSIAICGSETVTHEMTLKLLLKEGDEHDRFKEYYNIIPQCCRGVEGKTGPGKNMINYLAQNYRQRFLIPQCANSFDCK